jgi:hypothetical protein
MDVNDSKGSEIHIKEAQVIHSHPATLYYRPADNVWWALLVPDGQTSGRLYRRRLSSGAALFSCYAFSSYWDACRMS